MMPLSFQWNQEDIWLLNPLLVELRSPLGGTVEPLYMVVIIFLARHDIPI